MIPLPRLIDENGNEVRRIRPVSLSINEQIIPLTTAEMELVPGDSIPYRSYVELFTVNGSVGYFRAKTPSIGYGDITNTVMLEHAICEVGDYIVKEEIEQTDMSLENALLTVFSHYNGSLWQMGTVSVEADVVISVNYSNVLQTINSLLEMVPSAMLSFDFTTTPWTFNVVEKEQTVSAEGRLARNITSVTIQRNDNELCTRVWVNGLSEDPAEAYMDADTISTYGIVEKALDSNDYTFDQAFLMASSFLEKYKNPKYAVSINAIDLSSITGETLDQFRIGKLYRLVLPEGETIEETIVGLQWYDVYNMPNYVVITLSEDEEETTATILQGQTTDIYGNNGIKEKVYKDYSSVERALGERYVKTPGVDIIGGVDIHGNGKFLKVRAGGVVNVDLEGFKLDSANKKIQAGIARVSTSMTDFNSLTTDGAYYVGVSSMSNKPSGTFSDLGEVEVTSLGDSVIVQKLYTSSAMYMRRRISNSWSSWLKFTPS